VSTVQFTTQIKAVQHGSKRKIILKRSKKEVNGSMSTNRNNAQDVYNNSVCKLQPAMLLTNICQQCITMNYNSTKWRTSSYLHFHKYLDKDSLDLLNNDVSQVPLLQA
jgi:hypothetical protein